MEITTYLSDRPFRMFQEPQHLDVMSDIYQRYGVVAYSCREYCPGFTSLLDVGGTTHGLFERFLETASPGLEFSIANPGYNGIDGCDLPFGDNEFDVVTCIDTLEHVQPSDRGRVISEIRRVAKRLVVVAAPYDTPWTSGAEEMLYELSENKFLREHLEFGLPSLQDFRRYSADIGCKSTYLFGNHMIQDWFTGMLNYLKGASPNWHIHRNRFAALEGICRGSQFYRLVLVGVRSGEYSRSD